MQTSGVRKHIHPEAQMAKVLLPGMQGPLLAGDTERSNDVNTREKMAQMMGIKRAYGFTEPSWSRVYKDALDIQSKKGT